MRSPGKVLAVIPARGGSKGIPGKNILQLAGKPLVAYSIEQALATRTVSRVVVSTDSEEIAAVALAYGAEVVDRPDTISGDEASSELALLHCLEHLAANDGYAPDLVVFLQATSPLREASDIDAAVDALIEEGADSLFSAFPLHTFVWRVGDSGPAPFNYDPARRPRRQECPEDLAESGSIYVFRPWVLKECGSRVGGRVAVYRMSAWDSAQIDEPEDVPVVEFLLKSRHASRVGDRDAR